VDEQMPEPSGLDPVIGEAARGWVRVELDAGGQCREVVLGARVMDLSNVQLGQAVRDAIQQAQATLRERVKQANSAAGSRLATVLEESSAVADQRFGEIAGVLYGLERRAEREW
jgi:DNA-binding protein YbaB